MRARTRYRFKAQQAMLPILSEFFCIWHVEAAHNEGPCEAGRHDKRGCTNSQNGRSADCRGVAGSAQTRRNSHQRKPRARALTAFALSRTLSGTLIQFLIATVKCCVSALRPELFAGSASHVIAICV